MRLRVLGNTGRYLAPLSGGSCYVLEAKGARVLLDCGGGARDALRGELAEGAPPFDAVVLSHFHHDHVLDLVTILDAFGSKTRFFVPPGEEGRLEDMARAFAFHGPFELPGPVLEARPDETHHVGPLTMRFAPTRHSVPSFATRFDAVDGTSLVYASDTAPCETLEALARDADLLLMHTLLPAIDPETSHARRHATAETAAALAARAGAKHLLLSHRYHESHDEDMLAAAHAHPDVVLARDGDFHEVIRGPGSGRS